LDVLDQGRHVDSKVLQVFVHKQNVKTQVIMAMSALLALSLPSFILLWSWFLINPAVQFPLIPSHNYWLQELGREIDWALYCG